MDLAERIAEVLRVFFVSSLADAEVEIAAEEGESASVVLT